MSKEFTVTLTGPQRGDLWSFFYQHQAVKARDRDGLRNLDAVLETFGVKDVQERIEALTEDGKTQVAFKELPDFPVSTGSVDLKRVVEYLGAMPETVPTAMALRLLALGDVLDDVKNRRAPTSPVIATDAPAPVNGEHRETIA